MMTPAKIFWVVFGSILAAAAAIVIIVFGFRLALEVAHRPSRAARNQIFVVGSLRTINIASETYSSTYPHGFPERLDQLGPGPAGTYTSEAAGLIDEQLASGKKQEYIFTYTPAAPDRRGFISSYTVTARPKIFGVTGEKNFFLDQTGVIRETTENREPTAADPPQSGDLREQL